MADIPNTPGEYSQDDTARTLQGRRERISSDTFLWAGFAAMAASATLQAMGNKHISLFVGQWAPTLLILGLYNRVVNQVASDRMTNAM